MKKLLVCCLLVVVCCFSFTQQRKQEKLQQLKNREDVKVTEVEPNILKLEYTNGKTLYKNISNYKSPTNNNLQKTNYSPNYDSTIIDLTTIDTMLKVTLGENASDCVCENNYTERKIKEMMANFFINPFKIKIHLKNKELEGKTAKNPAEKFSFIFIDFCKEKQ